MTAQYTPTAAARLLGISTGAIRKYSDLYARFLSTEATTTPRTFTPADLRLLAYVARATSRGQTHDAILADLADDGAAYAAFVWTAPDDADQDSQPAPAALVPAAQLHAARLLLEEAQRREREAQERAESAARALQDRIATLERELGRAEGELAARRRPWWARLWGE
jgi:DNA-binding transcriptional MerR regulator